MIEQLCELVGSCIRVAVASWLVRAVKVRALAGDIVLCSWAMTLPLSTKVYEWVPANCWETLQNCGGVTCDGLVSRPGEVEILPAPSCYRNRDKLQQLWARLGSKASLFFVFKSQVSIHYCMLK